MALHLHPLDRRVLSRIRRDLGPHERLLGWLLVLFMSSVLLYAIATHDWSQWTAARPMDGVGP